MKEKDKATKKYIEQPEIFADVLNYYLYSGNQKISAEDLSEMNPDLLVTVLEKNEQNVLGESVEKIRDVLKCCQIMSSEDAIYVIIGVENQTFIDYGMPIRVFMYDAMNYMEQLHQMKKLHEKKKDLEDANEFLSGIKATDKFKPVITMVIYWSADAWEGPRTLHQILNMDEKVAAYVNDYKLNLIVPSEIKDYDKFETEIRYILQYIGNSEKEEGIEVLMQNSEVYKSISLEGAKVLEEITKIKISRERKGGKVSMCKAWDDHWLSGKQEGIKEGIQTFVRKNKEEGTSAEVICSRLVQWFELTPEQAQSYVLN